MDAAAFFTHARRAHVSILAAANGFQFFLNLHSEFCCVGDVVVLHTQPERASAFLWELSVSCFYQGFHAFATEAVVAEVNFFDILAMLEDISQFLHALVVNMILEEFQYAKVRAAFAEIYYLANT